MAFFRIFLLRFCCAQRDLAVDGVSVCLSVCPSDTLVLT